MKLIPHSKIVNCKITCLEMKERRNFEVLSSVKCNFPIYMCVNLNVCACNGWHRVCHTCTYYMDIFVTYMESKCVFSCVHNACPEIRPRFTFRACRATCE